MNGEDISESPLVWDLSKCHRIAVRVLVSDSQNLSYSDILHVHSVIFLRIACLVVVCFGFVPYYLKHIYRRICSKLHYFLFFILSTI